MSTFRSSRRILAASLVGTAVEFYDFYIYATAAALVFGPLFFAGQSASAQLLLSYATFGLAFVARPQISTLAVVRDGRSVSGDLEGSGASAWSEADPGSPGR